MDIGAAQIVLWIASSTNQSFETYSPIFLLIGGIVLAFIVISFLVGILTRDTGGAMESMDYDDTIEI